MEVGDQEWNQEKTSSKMQLGGQFSWKICATQEDDMMPNKVSKGLFTSSSNI